MSFTHSLGLQALDVGEVTEPLAHWSRSADGLEASATGETPPLTTTNARRLLGVGSENTIKARIGYGYLRGRRLPNGRTQVLLQNILNLRASSLISPPVSSASR